MTDTTHKNSERIQPATVAAERPVGRPAPKRNSKWRNTKNGLTARVMSAEPVEGYVVARYKGAAPWLLHVNDWHAKFEALP